VTSIVDAAVEEFRGLGKRVAFEAGPPQVLSVHPGLLRRAISNLIENAVKFGEAADVTVQRTSDNLIIRIADRGPGIEPELLSQVYEPFFRSEQSRNRDTGGSGLGLSIARSIAEMHGGELLLRNGDKGGLEAELRLRVDAA
jgi:signal transduction histidine kinase